MPVNPIRPEEVAANRKLPDVVMTAWNLMIAEKFDGQTAYIKQDDIVVKIADAMDVTRSVVFEKNWLEIEDMYRAAGWKVIYNKSMTGDNFDSHFIFKKGIA